MPFLFGGKRRIHWNGWGGKNTGNDSRSIAQHKIPDDQAGDDENGEAIKGKTREGLDAL